MADFDPDTYLEHASGAAPESFDPDKHLSDTLSGRHVPSKGTVAKDEPRLRASLLGQVGEAASGAYHSVVGGYKGIYTGLTTWDSDKAAKAVEDEQNKSFHAAKTERILPVEMGPEAQAAYARGTGDANSGQVLGDLAESAGAPPLISAAARTAPAALGSMFGGARGMGPAATASDAQAGADAAYAAQSQGAAAVAPDVAKLTPETQAEIAEAHASGAKIHTTALERHHEAETLPVPVRLTAGQARNDAGMISDEFNAKGKAPEIGNRYNEQDQALKDNLTEMHRSAAPTAVANTDIQNGQSAIDSLKRYDAPKKQEITDAYNAAKAANGGDLEMDGSKFTAAADAALKPQGRSRMLPSTVQGILDDVKANSGKMSLDDFEGYRTQLANEVRKAQRSGDGNAVAAINHVRDALENTPPASDASAAAKAAYDKARGLAKARYAELDADPAYKAAVEDDAKEGEHSDIADKFTDKFVLGGKQSQVGRLRDKLDAEGHEAVTSATMNFLKKKAGINPDTGAGNFTQKGYNDALAKVSPKAKELLADPDLIENTRKLGNVARYTQEQTRGGYANNSHTFVAAAKNHAANVLEGIANVKAGGIPVGTAVRSYIGRKGAAADLHETLKPGAGLRN